MSSPRPARPLWLFAGLFAVTLATLMLEVLDTRLLSVLTWYHLSFLAVSVAMLGMAAGAVFVFIAGEVFAPERAVRLLPAGAAALAIAMAVSHVTNLTIPIPAARGGSPAELAALAVATLILTVPFVLSGIVVTLALTRTREPIGILYGADLIGAAAGCLLIIALLDLTDITSTAFAASSASAIGAWCFARYAGARGVSHLLLAVILIGGAAANASADRRLGVIYPKSRSLWLDDRALDFTAWNAHSNVIVRAPARGAAFLWGPAQDAPETPVTQALAAIDGDAGTVITQWDGSPSSLDWVQYDVTSLPYRLRGGSVAIIGVGGGRDVLTAIWAGNTSITGIEINEVLVRALSGRYRDFARIATHPGVTLVHDEARSYLTRAGRRFDVLQMSLIDTWAATGAGAFTLSENGLYTREAWQVFLRALTANGVYSVSRWFDPGAASETTRLLALGVASLLDFGIAPPRDHLLLVTRGRVATLMISPAPFTAEDRRRIEDLSARHGFEVRASPWGAAADDAFERILASASEAELRRATEDPFFDFTPPTDARPFFFNMLKPGGFLRSRGAATPGVVSGNLLATRTLIALAATAAVLVLAIIAWPLAVAGRPAMPPRAFGAALLYFALIGMGFMLVQIPFLQRFSVFLGHPTYTFSVILFLMILSAGVGSLASERIDLHRVRAWRFLPAGIAALVLLEMALLQPVVNASVGAGLAGRTAVVALFVVPLAAAMGCCFPLGMRLVGEHSDRVTAWMWGVNGASGVMASILAVMVSMWLGIHVNLAAAAAAYGLLTVPMAILLASPAQSGSAGAASRLYS